MFWRKRKEKTAADRDEWLLPSSGAEVRAEDIDRFFCFSAYESSSSVLRQAVLFGFRAVQHLGAKVNVHVEMVQQYSVVSLHHILSQTKPRFGSEEAPLEAEGRPSRSRER